MLYIRSIQSYGTSETHHVWDVDNISFFKVQFIWLKKEKSKQKSECVYLGKTNTSIKQSTFNYPFKRTKPQVLQQLDSSNSLSYCSLNSYSSLFGSVTFLITREKDCGLSNRAPCKKSSKIHLVLVNFIPFLAGLGSQNLLVLKLSLLPLEEKQKNMYIADVRI